MKYIMIKNIVSILILFTSINYIHAQDYQMDIPKVEVRNGLTYWYGVSIDTIAGKSDLIFEGRILTDSAFFLSNASRVFTLHKVLVLKKFKGNFTSDTIRVVTWGGQSKSKWEMVENS